MLYDSKVVDEEIVDESIREQINQKSSEKDKKEELLKSLERKIDEMREEQETIQESSVRFACFLKLSAITTYNDAMVDYMNQMIREEIDLLNVDDGRSDARLRSLKEGLDSYKKKVAILWETKNEGDKTSAAYELPDIESLVTDLRNLKHSGEYIERP
jgi:hypothetical protein